MNLFFQILAFIFVASNHIDYAFYLPTKDIPCQTTGESPGLASSKDAVWFDTTVKGFFSFTMSNHTAATLAKKSSKPANLAVAAQRQQINYILNEYFDFNGVAAPVDILCHLITETSADKTLFKDFKQKVIFEASRLIKLITQLNELRTEEPTSFTFKGKEVGHA